LPKDLGKNDLAIRCEILNLKQFSVPSQPNNKCSEKDE